ncbi:MAG TPA: hypothetical protein VIK91_12090 [Nannocystis sp.]
MEHRIRTVAQNEQCTVQQCTCGVLHVSVGSVTLRLRAPAAAGLRDGLAAALQKIAADTAGWGPAARGGDLPS